jgi:uncharacterized repeat protein (TIGR01451 family)
MFLILSFLASAAYAAPQVELNITVEKDVTSTNDKGEEVTQRVLAEEAIQGDTLFYSIHYKNIGDEAATNVQLDNPIAEGNRYIANSAWGDNSIITFTINGKEYQPASQLNKNIKTDNGKAEQQLAVAEDYTAIRWQVKEIKPGATGKVGFNTSVD